MTEKIELEELTTEHRVTIRGKTYAVRPIDGFGMQLIHATSKSDKLAMIRSMYKIAARCLGVTFDEVFGTEDLTGFSEAEVMEVVDIAQSQVKKVEESVAKNSEPAGSHAIPVS